MAKAKNIIEGWASWVMKNNPDKEALSKKRMAICDGCEYDSKGRANGVRPDRHCIACGCTLAAKTRVFKEKCPMGHWPAINPENNEQK